MQRILTVIVLLTLVLSFTFPVSAAYHQSRGREVRQQVATRVAEVRTEILPNLQDLKNRLQQLREQRKQERVERQATRRAEIATKVAELKSRVIERIQAVFTNILNRMTAALERLDKIVARINSRIAKLANRGVNTAQTETALAGCGDEQAQAKKAIDDSKAKIGSIDPASTTVRAAVQQASSAVRDGKRALQNYHKCLVNVIRTLKAAVPKEGTESAR